MKKVGICLSDYIRPGKSIGIIGGGSLGFLLALQAKAMGFVVNVLDPVADCPASKVCDQMFIADYNSLIEIERLSRVSDVLTYTTNELNVDTLSSIQRELNLPQGIDILALSQDALMEKGFLEDHGINVAPYATIVRITDVEENIDGIGYPCLLRQTRGDRQLVIEGASDIIEAMDLVKNSTCILETMISSAKTYSLSVARNAKEEMTFFPIVETIYDYEGLKETTTVVDLDSDLMGELERIATVIAESLNLYGVLTVEYSITEDGAIYVHHMVPFPEERLFYSLEACEISGFEAHLRGICNWPLMDYSRLLSNALTRIVLGHDLSEAKRQVPHQAHWHFHFYDRNDAFANTIVGHITILTSDIEEARLEIEKIMA